jgi:hypothetical protein
MSKEDEDKTQEPDDKNFDYMKTIKDNLDNIILDKEDKEVIDDLVIRTNKIVIHAYQFIKLFCIWRLQENRKLPLITKDFISNVFKIVTIRKIKNGSSISKGNKKIMNELKDFYKNVYSKTVNTKEKIYYDKLCYILPYEAIDMVTNINVNIQEHFIDHLYKYVNIVFDVKAKTDEITKNTKDIKQRKVLKKEVWDEIKQVKKDLTTFGDYISDPKYHIWISEQKTKIFPGITKFSENSLHYDIKVNPQKYLISMFYISNEFEKINKINEEKNKTLDNDNQIKQIRLFNVLPLRTNIISKNICLDTCGLIMNFMENPTNLLKTYKQDNLQTKIWNLFLNLDKSSYRKQSYKFHHMIRTDGVSCSILFIRTDEYGNPLSKGFSECKEKINTDYIENINLSKIKGKRIVCADPGKSDLIYCGSRTKDKLDTFRYTQAQRNVETRSKKYNKIMDKLSKKTIINDQTVKELETNLSNYNSKSCDFDKFKLYLVEKNKINYQLYKYYEQRLFRKFKLNRYINTQKSESKMLKNFSKKFGKPDKTVFVIGDYDKGSYNMKGCEPSICKKFRKIFKNYGYQTYLINEFRTSKISNCCSAELEKFLYKTTTSGKQFLCHGLLRCTSITHNCQTIHNRDKNAVQNMLTIVESLFLTGKRPDEFSRTEQPTQTS